MSAELLQARVHAMRYEAQGVVSVELQAVQAGEVLPAFTPGSHIDLHLASDLVRSYSLSNAAPGQGRYVVGVLNDPRSRGGSRYVHEKLRVGQVLPISVPRNNFELDAQAAMSVLVAGGIGVTPILAMAQGLSVQGRGLHVIYCAKSRIEAAFVQELQALCGPEGLTVHWDADKGCQPDLKALLAPFGAQAHYYCCGPTPMLDAFERTCSELQFAHVHVERFTGVDVSSIDQSNGFELVCQKSQRVVQVPAGKSILDVLVEEGIDPDHSCREGVCGACETRVLEAEGGIDHQDAILSDKEREAGKTMMVCVSRCKGKRLVLDV